MQQTTTVCEGRWGYHPCDYPTFLRLKEAHGLLLRAYRDCKRRIRWDMKDSHNRKGEQPTAPVDFLEWGWHRLDKNCFSGLGFRRFKGQNYYLKVLREYRSARIPRPTPDEVIPLDLPEDLEDVIAELREFYG